MCFLKLFTWNKRGENDLTFTTLDVNLKTPTDIIKREKNGSFVGSLPETKG